MPFLNPGMSLLSSSFEPMCSSLPVVLNVATEVVTNSAASPGACLQPGTHQEDEHSRSAILDILHQDDDVEVLCQVGSNDACRLFSSCAKRRQLTARHKGRTPIRHEQFTVQVRAQECRLAVSIQRRL